MPLAPVSFLIVDDSPSVMRFMRIILRNFGITNILTASNAAEGLSTLRTARIDLAFIDLDLGGAGEGLRLLRLIRTAADSPDPHLPVIALSACYDQHRVAAARDAGATEFLAKPVSPAEVFRRISAAVEQPRRFVRSAAYHGPDRRRRDDPAYAGPERRRSMTPAAGPELALAAAG